MAVTSFFTPQDPRFKTGTLPRKVPSYTTLDLFLRGSPRPNLTLSAAILNVTGEMPPYDPSDGTYLYDIQQHDIRGHIYRIGMQYRF